uniref:Uncharacterized protein n=1 Tax=Megaselia scalaris TaxID=36166 RepID=T1GQ96_MEGSC
MVKIIMKLFHFLNLEQQAVCKMLNTRIKYARKNRFSNNSGDEFQTPHKKSKNEDLKDTTPNIQEDIAFLEECNTAIDVPRIKSALERTLSHRMGQYTQENFSVINTYRFFTKSLNLINYEFNIRFPEATEYILSNFEMYLDAASNIFRAENQSYVPKIEVDQNIQKFLYICHYTKHPRGPRDKCFTMEEMLDDFVQFQTEDEDCKPEPKEHPMILAQGSSKADIDKYFLQIGEHLIEFPCSFTFTQAFDYLAKSYYVFNIAFPKKVTIFFHFIMKNIYDVHIKSSLYPKKNKIEDNFVRPR